MKISRVLHYSSVFLLFITISFEGQGYYISNKGLNRNNGISAGSVMQPLDKLNVIKLAPVSTVYLEAGSVFRNPLIVQALQPLVTGSRIPKVW